MASVRVYFLVRNDMFAASLAAGTVWTSCRAEMAISGTWCVRLVKLYGDQRYLGRLRRAALKATTGHT
ncbi:hypothetical protein [Paenibacillus macerans]|uniref:hypothetical protein n=1 Tax=Paenibacillus macerans TaxID=44252 RepID=UPI00203C0CB8|nr:hypothetical protein [Paenibacillus macerans]MCM3702206.1 hypothetical protein [Paenibacillus macerans]